MRNYFRPSLRAAILPRMNPDHKRLPRCDAGLAAMEALE